MLGAKTEVVISMYASNATNTAAATYTLPINTPPDSGTISATPLEGDSLSTSFEISTSGWVDDDLPLNYQFGYSKNATTTISSITKITAISTQTGVSTWLSANNEEVTIYLTVIVYDTHLGSSTDQISVVVRSPNLTDTAAATSSMKSALSGLSSIADPQRRME